jgi:hypothetical protein
MVPTHATVRLPTTVTSQQRLPLVFDDASEAAYDYFAWLRRWSLGLVRVTNDGSDRFDIRLLGVSLIRMHRQADAADVVSFSIIGGLVAHPLGRLVFDLRSGVVSLHEYRSRYPNWLYRHTQAPLHAWIMERYAASLDRRVR